MGYRLSHHDILLLRSCRVVYRGCFCRYVMSTFNSRSLADFFAYVDRGKARSGEITI